MSEQKYIGIDAGLDGAIVTLDSAGNICETREMPSVKIGKGREIDYAAIALMFKWEFLQDSIITIEDPGKHAPGASGLWSMTTCFSAIRMATVGYDYRHLIVTAKEWQKEFFSRPKMPKGSKFDTKAAALSEARKLWPTTDFSSIHSRKPIREGIVDAALIAEYGRRKLRA